MAHQGKNAKKYVFEFVGPWKTWPQMAPNGTLEFLFPTNLDLADILGRTDLDFENIHVLDFVDPKFLDFQVCRSSNFWISRSPDLEIPRFPGPQISRFPDAAGAGATLQGANSPCCDQCFATKILIPGSWRQDLDSKILVPVPRRWYQEIW